MLLRQLTRLDKKISYRSWKYICRNDMQVPKKCLQTSPKIIDLLQYLGISSRIHSKKVFDMKIEEIKSVFWSCQVKPEKHVLKTYLCLLMFHFFYILFCRISFIYFGNIYLQIIKYFRFLTFIWCDLNCKTLIILLSPSLVFFISYTQHTLISK